MQVQCPSTEYRNKNYRTNEIEKQSIMNKNRLNKLLGPIEGRNEHITMLINQTA